MFGNQTSFTADSIVYTNYTYRPDGLRHSIDNKVHVWDGANIVADIDSSNVSVYIRGVNLIYADDGDKTYYHFNAHGDVVVLTNSNGSKTKSYSYNAFGVEYNEATLDDNPFRYCGEYYDKETQTIYLRARYYNPAQGRFTQQDGWAYANPQDPLSLNLYTYCWNNPIRYRDYSGNVPVETIADIAGILFSAIDFCKAPGWSTFGMLAWDVAATLIPYVPGSYVGKGIKFAGKTDFITDLAKFFSKADNLTDQVALFRANRESIVGSYKSLKKVVKDLGISKDYEIHHLIEKRFANKLGLEGKTDDFLSIALLHNEHSEITQLFRLEIGYARDSKAFITTKTAEPQNIWNAIVKVYETSGMKEYLPMLAKYLKENMPEKKFKDISDWKGYLP